MASSDDGMGTRELNKERVEEGGVDVSVDVDVGVGSGSEGKESESVGRKSSKVRSNLKPLVSLSRGTLALAEQQRANR